MRFNIAVLTLVLASWLSTPAWSRDPGPEHVICRAKLSELGFKTVKLAPPSKTSTAEHIERDLLTGVLALMTTPMPTESVRDKTLRALEHCGGIQERAFQRSLDGVMNALAEG